MEIKAPNDIFIATFNNPGATTYDLMSLDLNPDNTSLYSKDEYKNTPFVKNTFKTETGEFDNVTFDNFYNLAENHYKLMTDEQYLKDLDEIMYSPFDITRPKDSKTFRVNVEYAKDYNPFKQLYSRTSVNSIDENPLSLRELAQQGKIFDYDSQKWLDESVNDRSLLNKFFGDTLVYAQWDEDGIHEDPVTGRNVKHKKGDWKIDKDGNLYIETLGKREIYGKQIVNPMDTLTTDGTLANKLDIFDSDNRESSALRTTLKLSAEIAPLLIPGANIVYGGVRAAIGLSSALPTFFKSLEGILLGDNTGKFHDIATAAEGYMAKFTASSTTDEAQGSLFNYEQMAGMVSDIFSQIYEQRAAASLSKLFYRPSNIQLSAKQTELVKKINEDVFNLAIRNKISSVKEMEHLQRLAISKVPELQKIQRAQSIMSRSFSLGYMALTSTADIYGEALQSGYDRRTAGFAGLMAASGTYALMMNNRMGDWFLDKTTGYTTETNKALMRKAVREYMEPIDDAIKTYAKNPVIGKSKLAFVTRGIKDKMDDLFNNSSVIGEALWKNAIIEGIEEVSEELVIDSTKGIVDVMSYLGLTKKKGSFGGVDNVFSAEGAQRYLASLVGGFLGGALFEFNRTKIEPWIRGEKISFDTRQSIYELVSNGQTETLITEINKNRQRLGNKYINPFMVEGESATENGFTHADAVADMAISLVRNVEQLMQSENLIKTDEEIIKRALLDHIIIKDLEASKGDNKYGIEGLIVDDFRRNGAKLTDINDEIKKLMSDEENNKKAIKELQDEAKIYRQRLDDIIQGKRAENYFTQALYYLNKQLSEHWTAIDRVTFVKTKYDKNYYDLPESGTGITKERVDKEWKDYIESTNLRENIEIATNAYLEMEKNMANPTSKYIESGYSEERKKTLKNILDLSFNFKLFDVSSDKAKKESIERYLATAKEIEEKTGKRIIPWDVIAVDLFNQVNNEGLIISNFGNKLENSYLEEEVIIGEQKMTRGEIIKDFLRDSTKNLPSDVLIYSMLADRFNSMIEKYNAKIDQEIENLESEITDENREEVKKRQDELADKKMLIKLLDITKSTSVQRQEELLAPQLNQEQLKLGLFDTVKNQFNPDIITKVFGSYQEILQKYAESLNKEVINLTDDEIVNALQEIITISKILYPNDDSIINLITSNNEDKFTHIESLVNATIDLFNSQVKAYNEYNTFKQELTKTIKLPEFFSNTNYTIKIVIDEIKKSKNLDKELFNKIEKFYSDTIFDLKTEYFKGKTISDEDFFHLIENIDEITNQILNYNQDPDLLEKPLPDYLLKIINNSQNPEDEAYVIESHVGQINNNITSIKETINNLSELKEILDKKEDFISNTLYDFLQEFELFLEDKKKPRKKSIFAILKSEEFKLFGASDITNYIQEGVQETDMVQAINTLRLMRSVVSGLKTTDIGIDDPYGFIETRKKFVERNKIDSFVTKIKTVSSDISELMDQDLRAIENKIEFLIELSKQNSGKIFTEQEEIRKSTNRLLLLEWRNLVKEKPDLPDISDILENSTYDNEKKLLEIENRLYEKYKDSSNDDKITLIKELTEIYKFSNVLEKLYDKDGTNRITKDIKGLSNNDFLLYLGSIISFSPKDFNNKLLSILKEGFDKAPFFTQELAARITYASIVNPELFSEIVKDTRFDLNNLTDKITYILGNAGTGKTTVLFKLIVLMLKDSNPNLSIWFSGPHIDKAVELHKNVLQGIDSSKFNNPQILNKENLFERLGIKEIVEKIKNNDTDIVTLVQLDEGIAKIQLNLENQTFNLPNDLPNLIFIDEVTHFQAWELELLNEVVNRANSSNKKIKIIGAGDQTQLGATSSRLQGISYNVDRVSGIFIPQLTLTVRAANSQKRENSDFISALVKKAISTFEGTKDSPTIVNYIGNGVLLKSHLSKNVLTGEIITSDKNIPSDILNTLKNIITTNPDTIIGILSDSLDIDPNLSKQLTSAGISESNYKIYTEKTIQGSEADYFILNLSSLQSEHILQSLRKLYTYTTRSREGTIILNDLEGKEITNQDGTILKLKTEYQDYTQAVQPLKQESINENKKIRQDILEKILDPDFTIHNDFKFDEDEISLTDEIIDDHTFTREQGEFKPEDEIIDPQDDYNYRVHTFYNDLNVQYSESAKEINLTKNTITPFSYGLDFLFKEGENSKSIPKDEFENWFNKNVELKYEIWDTYYNTKKDKFKIPENNPILEEVFGAGYNNKHNIIESELVIAKSKYDANFNAPQDKRLDQRNLHLTSGSDYLNLFLKLKSQSTGKEYYIHLGTFPKISTVEEYNKITGNKFVDSAKRYKEFIESDFDEISITPEQIEIRTSTRLVKNDANKPSYTVNDLVNFKGLKFWDGVNFSKKPVIKLFPTNFDDFVKLYDKATFERKGVKEDPDAKLKRLERIFYGKEGVPGYRGKPYVAVSFLNKTSHVQFLLLKSKHRSIKEMSDIVRNPIPGTNKDARQLIFEKHPNILPILDSFFSGNQVLDMLISLAVKKPDLFNKFFKDGNSILEKTSKEYADKKWFLDKYLSSVGKVFSQDLLTHITYSTKDNVSPLREVMNMIQNELNKYERTKVKPDEKKIKDNIINIIRVKPVWWSKFWNIITFKNTIENVLSNPDVEILDDVKTLYEEFNETLNQMFKFWDEEFRHSGDDAGRFYYNVPITSKIGGGFKLADLDLNFDYLFTTLTPEGPFLNVNLEKEVKFENTKKQKGKGKTQEEIEIDNLKTKLSLIKYNKKVIYNSEDTDTLDTLNEKINRAQTIKTILEHKNNKGSYKLNELLNSAELDKILTALNSMVDVVNIDSALEQLDQLISEEESEKNDLIKGLYSSMKYIMSDLNQNEDDKKVVSELIQKWNDKVFNNQNIFEFLQSLPDYNSDIISELNLENAPELITVFLTNYVYEALGINTEYDNIDLSLDIFTQCN